MSVKKMSGTILTKIPINGTARLHLAEALGDLFTRPYHDRLFIVFDSKHSASTIKLQNQLGSRLQHQYFVENGVEYLYPEDILAEMFHCDVLEVKKINLEADPHSIQWHS